MSAYSGPEIVNDALVFAYDMGPNPGANKSWKGAPTANLYGNATDYNSGLSLGRWFRLDDTIKSIQLSSTFNSWCVRWSATLSANTQYTFSCEHRSDVDNSTFVLDNDGVDDNTWNTTVTSTTEWQTYKFTRTNIAAGTMNMYARRNSGGNIFIRKIQIEQQAFATPFVNGTRSNTEALLDWTGNNTITINGLTYNSDGTFNYYGTNGTGLILPGTNFSLNEQTIECWCYASSFVQNGFMFEKTTNNLVNTQYSFFFNNNATHLYYRTYGLTPRDLTRTTSTSGVINNQWNHMVATFDGSTKKIYVNGAQKVSEAVTGTITQNTTGSAYIGTYGNFVGYPYNGKIGVTRIYNRALTANEITINFNTLRGRYGI